MKKTFVLLFLFISTVLFAQKFTLEGIIQDQDANPLEGATVFILSLKDSIINSYGITNKNGDFSFRVNANEAPKLIFNIAYLGYKPFTKDIDVPKADELDMGVVILKDQIEELEEVSIIVRTPPVVMKKDTIEYNADSFKTLPNDKAEDLLKQLPGIEIDDDGVITANGVTVEAVNVDGMRFFGEKGGDIALKNIPSNVISKVQVTDYKSNLQKFTGEESDSGTKEINLKIKKGKNTATFGDFNGGYGTDKKYQANANLFKLIDGKQLGIIMGANNINLSRGFNALPETDTSTGDIKSDFIGANYSKGKWNETRVNANYRYSQQTTDTEQTSHRENFLPNLNYITDSNNSSTRDSDNHTGGLDLKFIVKPKNKLSNTNLQLSNEIDFNTSNSELFSLSDRVSQNNDGSLVSDFNSEDHSNTSNSAFKNSFRITKKLRGRRDYFNIGLTTNFNKGNTDREKDSKNEFFNGRPTIIQNQISNSDNKSATINLNANWNKELFTNFTIIPKFNINRYQRKDEKYVYDFNDIANEYDDFNEQLSSHNTYKTITVKPSLRLRYDYKELRFEIEGAFINTKRDYIDELLSARNFEKDFEYLTYSGRVRFRDDKGYKNISLGYNQNVSLPSVNHLQPVANVNNPLHIITGNPLLKPAVSHRLNFDYQNNLAFNNINITGNANANFTQDKIANSTITDQDLIRYTSYTNLNGDYSLSGNVAVSKSYFSRKTNINLNLRLRSSFNNSLSIQNAIKFTTESTNITPSFSFKYAYDKKLDFRLTYSYAIRNTLYDTDVFNDVDYFVQNVKFNSSIYFLKDAFFTNKIAYRYNSRVGDAFDGDAVFWNAGLGVQLWDSKGTLTLVGYDILGKNNGYRRTVSESYIQDVESKILEQYFMVTFIYKFGRFAGQNVNVRGNGGGRRGRSGGFNRNRS